MTLAAGLVTVTLWGSAFVAIRAAGDSLDPGSIALGRLVVSSILLGAVALVRRESLPPRRALLPIATFGVLFLGGYSVTLNTAERRVDAGTAALIVNTGPLLIAILAGLFLHEGFSPGLFVGCGIALAGCALMSGSGSVAGIVLCCVAALLYASAVVVQKVALARATAFQVTWLGCAFATAACLPFAPALVGQASPGSVPWLLYLGAFPTALGFATWSYALRRGTAGRVASLNYLIPVVAIVLGWLYLGERPSVLASAGGALCIAGVATASRRRPGRVRRRWRGTRPAARCSG